VKNIGFLTFGQHSDSPDSPTRTQRDALVQTVDLAVAAEGMGFDSAFIRVHHYSRQLISPFPLLATLAARTTTIDLGTGVIDMRYENPLYMSEEAAVTDLLSDGRLQLGLGRGSPESALQGYQSFGFIPAAGETDVDLAREHTAIFRYAIAGHAVATSNPATSNWDGPIPIEPQSEGLSERIWWGSGTRESARWCGEQGMNLMSSTLLTEDTGAAHSDVQAEQIRIFRRAWTDAGHPHQPRVAVTRSIIPISPGMDREVWGEVADAASSDAVGSLDGHTSRFGRRYIGDAARIIEDLSTDAAVQEADTILLDIPALQTPEFNVNLLSAVINEVAPSLGWR